MRESPLLWPERFESHHRSIARSLGISDPQHLLLTPSCTSALSVGLWDHPWQAGDRLLISAWEHRALQRPALMLQERGVELVVIPPDGALPVDLSKLRSELEKGARLVAMSAAANTTGALLPIEQVTSIAHEHGALMLVDAAQTVGWGVEPQIGAAGASADLFTFAGHKGPQAPWGIGGLYRASGVQMSSPGTEGGPGYCDTGSVDRLALAGLAEGLRWMRAQPDRLQGARRVIQRLAEGLQEMPGVSLIGAPPVSQRMPTLAFLPVGRSVTALGGALQDQGVIVSAGRQCAPLAHQTLGTQAEGVVRLSAGPSSSVQEAESCLKVLRQVLA